MLHFITKKIIVQREGEAEDDSFPTVGISLAKIAEVKNQVILL